MIQKWPLEVETDTSRLLADKTWDYKREWIYMATPPLQSKKPLNLWCLCSSREATCPTIMSF